MALKKVELIRQRIVRGQQSELVRLRQFISSAGENEEAVEALHGDSGLAILAVVADTVLRELGHGTDLEVDDGHSKTKRAAAIPRRRVG